MVAFLFKSGTNNKTLLIKTIRYILIFWCVLQLSRSGVHAQASQSIGGDNGAVAYANISCYVISPIGITKVNDMYFGTIVSGNAGSVTLTPNGERPVTTGNVSLKSAQGIISAAAFEINDGLGAEATTRFFTGYSISLPTSDITLVSDDGKTMRVSNFTSIPSSSGYGSFTNGKGVLTVGATLYVNASQGVGKYVSTSPFPVTVNFY
jgi:hypothetical protein